MNKIISNNKAYKAFKKDFEKDKSNRVAQIVKPAIVLKVAEYVEQHHINWEAAL